MRGIREEGGEGGEWILTPKEEYFARGGKGEIFLLAAEVGQNLLFLLVFYSNFRPGGVYQYIKPFPRGEVVFGLSGRNFFPLFTPLPYAHVCLTPFNANFLRPKHTLCC